MKLNTLIATLVLAISLVGCGHKKDAKAIVKLLEAETGQDYEIAKLHTSVKDYVVLQNKVTGEYVAYNLSNFKRKEMKTLSSYLAVATGANDIVHNLTPVSVTTEHTESGGGYWETYEEPVYDWDGNVIGYTNSSYYVEPWSNTWYTTTTYYEGGGFSFAQNTAQSKDLEGLAAAVDEANARAVTETMVQQYGLAEDKAESLANLAINYSKLSDSRSLTAADKEVFAKNALSVSYAELESAYKQSAQGQGSAKYDSLVSRAAKANGTSPETARVLMNLYFNQEE